MVRVARLGGGRVRCAWPRLPRQGRGALGGAAPLLLIAFLGWLLFWMPSVVVHDAGVTLENPFRSIEVPWGAMVHVDTRFALTLVMQKRATRPGLRPTPESGVAAMPARKTSRACRQPPTGPASRSIPAT